MPQSPTRPAAPWLRLFNAQRTCRVTAVTGFGVALLTLGGCEAPRTYETAFSQQTALAGNTHTYDATPDQVFRASKVTLVQQGFTVEQADVSTGLLKGLRTFDDPKNRKIAYLVTATVDITGASSSQTVATVSASQQTVLHKDSQKYYHLLGLVPIPTGKEYQTVVRAEGNITGASFYRDFFAAVSRNMARLPSENPAIRLSAARPEVPAAQMGQPPPKSQAVSSPAELPTATAAPLPATGEGQSASATPPVSAAALQSATADAGAALAAPAAAADAGAAAPAAAPAPAKP
jgi:hypothetical protein